mmetsp:Transcript_118581/g.335442  ORF Transcript_118581/g.335442 Transcript_118581/m.335442 type:complete len:406 (-) Transcript_118581:122-1339(-)
MAFEAAAALGQDPGGGWLSFPALFSDGDCEVGRGVLDAEGSEAHSCDSEASELSALRLDIFEIQEAIKNHDLWVQDAVEVRADIEGLQVVIREHEKWMTRFSSICWENQARAKRFDSELADMRRLVGDPVRSGRAQASPTQIASGPASIDKGILDDGEALVGGGIKSCLCDGRDTALAFERVERCISEQIGQGLRRMRNIVVDVEGGLSWRFDSERAARRAAFADREEFASVAMAPVSLTSVSDRPTPGGMDFFDESFACGNQPKKVAAHTLSAFERLTEDRIAEIESTLAELQSNLKGLLAEQQLETVVAGALALAGNHLSSQQQLQSIGALEEKAAWPRRRQCLKHKASAEPPLCREFGVDGLLDDGNGPSVAADPQPDMHFFDNFSIMHVASQNPAGPGQRG